MVDTLDEGALAADDEADLSSFGYKQELNRGLRFWTTWAIGFAFVSPIVGLYTIVALGATAAGPAWMWAIPLVAIGQMTLAMVYAQLSARWPLSGGIYQWTRRLIGPAGGWWAGWFYMWATTMIVAGVTYSGGMFLGELLGLKQTSATVDIGLALVLLGAVTLINCVGLNVLKYAVVIGICAELVGSVTVGIALLIVARKQPLSVLVDTSMAPGGSAAFFGAFIAAVAFAGWAFLGFDACGSVAEETQDPVRLVPRAILWSLPPVIAVEIIGAVALMISTPDLPAVISGVVEDPVGDAVETGLGPWAVKPFLAIVVVGFGACALAVQTTAARVVFSFARDRQIPGSTLWRKVSAHKHVPVYATLGVAALATLAFLYSNALSVLVKFSTGSYFVAFLFPVAAFAYARLRGRWRPHPGAPFRGRVGQVVTYIALAWAIFECVNIAWPRRDVTPQATWAVPVGLIAFTLLGAVYFGFRRPDKLLHDGATCSDDEQRTANPTDISAF